MTNTTPTPRQRPIIRLFVSSTFSDLIAERNALADHVWPQLERLCQSNGFQFQAIDLRWGVPTEAGLDHRTMRICFDELRRSQAISPQPNFLILLGDRYGWQPLPEEITPAEFDKLVAAAIDQHERDVLSIWYRLDTNQRPEAYHLRSRYDKPDGEDYTKTLDEKGQPQDTPAWKAIQTTLWSIINRAFPVADLANRFPPDAFTTKALPSIVRFQGSATEQEIWHGALQPESAAGHVIAFDRRIDKVEQFATVPGLGAFINVDPQGAPDKTLSQALEGLKQQLKSRLGENYLDDNSNRVSLALDPAKNELQLQLPPAYLDHLCQSVLERLEPIIKKQIDEYNDLPPPGADAHVTPEVLRELQRERAEHARFADERVPKGGFVGRVPERAKLLAYLHHGNERPFIVYGVSGSGKTALLAQVAREANGVGILIRRFLGTTKHSSDLRSLLIDLCYSLREHFPRADELPTDLRLLEKEFYEQLAQGTAERPIFVLLDALDQLDPADDAHALWWIRSTPLPPHARLVVSCLSDPDDQVAGRPYAVLQQRGLLTESNTVAIVELTTDEASKLWRGWLKQSNRELTIDQQAAVDARILDDNAPACRQPLYLKILFEETRQWRSYNKLRSPIVPESVSELLDGLFDRLCAPKVHGPLVEPVLAYLVTSRFGLMEAELLEVLFRDPDYHKQLIASSRHALPANTKRIPIALWARLRYDLQPYLAERAAIGGQVLAFYHRQFAEWVKRRLPRFADLQQLRHSRLAAYFRLVADPSKCGKWLCRSPRPFSELPWQLIRSGDIAAIDHTLGDLLFLEAKSNAGLLFDLIDDCRDSSTEFKTTTMSQVTLAVVSAAPFIISRPTSTLQSLRNRLQSISDLVPALHVQTEKVEGVLDSRGPWIKAHSPIPGVESGFRSIMHDPEAIASCIDSKARHFYLADAANTLQKIAVDNGVICERRPLPLPATDLAAIACLEGTGRLAFFTRNGEVWVDGTRTANRAQPRDTKVLWHRIQGLVFRDSSGKLIAWNPDTDEKKVLIEELLAPIRSLRFRTDFDRLLVVAGDETQSLYTIDFDGCVARATRHLWTGPEIIDADWAFSHPHSILACVDRSLRLVDLFSGSIAPRNLSITRYESRDDVRVLGRPIRCEAGHGDSSEFVFFYTLTGQVGVWDWKSDTLKRLDSEGLDMRSTSSLCFAWLNDLEVLAVGTSSETRLLARDSVARTPRQHHGSISHCVILGERFASYSQEDGYLRCFSLDGLKLHGERFQGSVSAVAKSASSEYIVLGDMRGGVWAQSLDLFQSPPAKIDVTPNVIKAICSCGPNAIIAADANGSIKSVDLRTGASVYVAFGQGDKEFVSLHYITHSDRLACVYVDKIGGDIYGILSLLHLRMHSQYDNTLAACFRSLVSAVLYIEGHFGVNLVPRSWRNSLQRTGVRSEEIVYRNASRFTTAALSSDAQYACLSGHSLILLQRYHRNRWRLIEECLVDASYVSFVTTPCCILLVNNQESCLELRSLVDGLPVMAAIDLPHHVTSCDVDGNRIVIGMSTGYAMSLSIAGIDPSYNHT